MIKLAQPLWYGMTQVVGGLAAWWAALPPSLEHETTFVAAIALGVGVYLMIDGLENVVKAIRSSE